MTYLIELYVPVRKQVIQTSIYLVFKGWLVYQIFFKQQLSFVELYFCYSSYVFRHLYGNFFFDGKWCEIFRHFFTSWSWPQGFSANGGWRANWMRASPLARSSVLFDINIACSRPRRGGGGEGTALYGLYRYLPLWRVWFSGSLL